MIQASGVVSARVWRTLLYVLFTSFSFESLDTVTSERSWRVNTSAEVFTRWPKTWNKLLGATWEYFNSSFQQKRFSQRIHTSTYWTLYLMNLQNCWRKTNVLTLLTFIDVGVAVDAGFTRRTIADTSSIHRWCVTAMTWFNLTSIVQVTSQTFKMFQRISN